MIFWLPGQRQWKIYLELNGESPPKLWSPTRKEKSRTRYSSSPPRKGTYNCRIWPIPSILCLCQRSQTLDIEYYILVITMKHEDSCLTDFMGPSISRNRFIFHYVLSASYTLGGIRNDTMSHFFPFEMYTKENKPVL